VALHYLRRPLSELGDLLQLARRRPDPQHHGELVAERAGIDLGAVGADHARLLEALEPVGHGGR
jgi:hypothetical protein